MIHPVVNRLYLLVSKLSADIGDNRNLWRVELDGLNLCTERVQHWLH